LADRDYLNSLLYLVCSAAWFVINPFAQSVNAIRKAPVRFVIDSARIKSSEVCTRLDQGRNAPSESVTLRVTFSEFSREEVGQFDLTYLTLDFVIAHPRIEIVFKAIFAQKLDEEFLG
jgi:hypothetical protein